MNPIDIISLTPKGEQLAQRLLSINVHKNRKICHMHRPKPFKEKIQQRFKDNHHFIFICATAIVIRTLADVLGSKYDDPPILVVDENGRFVIPLLSGHEGGANRWAQEVADNIAAQLVITSSQTYVEVQYDLETLENCRPIFVVGMGCEKNCSAQNLRSLFDATLLESNIQLNDIVALSSIDVKQNEPALLNLAKELCIPYICYSASELREMEDRLSERSELVFKAVGCYGVAEAAALLHSQKLSQRRSELVVKKQKNAYATIAVARLN